MHSWEARLAPLQRVSRSAERTYCTTVVMGRCLVFTWWMVDTLEIEGASGSNDLSSNTD